MKLIRIGGQFVLQCRYEDKDTAKSAGMRWNPTARVWATNDIVVARKLRQYADEETIKKLEAETEKVKAVIEESRATDSNVSIPAPAGLEYMPFQRAGIAFASSRKNILIADEMGLGKTIQAIGTINLDANAKNILVICPASLKLNWARELAKWLVLPRKTEILNGKESEKQSEIYIVNYDILSKHDWLAEKEWDIVVCDEAHYAKNPKAARTKACLSILRKAKKKIMLTGTPIMNRPVELQTILAALGCDFAQNWIGYVTKYCDGYRSKWGWDVKGASNLDDLQEKLRSTVMIRRLKKDVLVDLPAKTRQIIEIPTTGFSAVLKAEEKVMSSYEEKRKELAALKKQAEAQKDDASFAAKIDALKTSMQIAFAEIARVRHETALAKTGFTIDYITDMLESENKIILFCHHQDVLDQIFQAFPGIAVKFTGAMSAEEKQKSVDRFQSDPACKIFVGSIMAAGTGITLTAASTVIFHELALTPGAMSQAEDRAHRIGQQGNVLVQHLVVDGSIDSSIAKMLKAKQEIIEKSLDRTVDANEEIEIGLT